jgi:WD40 repeat protein
LLRNGKVLVVGGYNGGPLSTAELYDPDMGMWNLTGPLNTARYSHTATLLPNGKVLVAGGAIDNSSNATATAELYDPDTGMWTTTMDMGMGNEREDHTATLLPNGKVLVAGGSPDGSSYLNTAELYDPAGLPNGTWTATGSLTTARGFHTATLLPNGKVLVRGGAGGFNSAELYDPASRTWIATTNGLTTERFEHTATLLPNGKVLVAGERIAWAILRPARNCTIPAWDLCVRIGSRKLRPRLPRCYLEATSS